MEPTTVRDESTPAPSATVVLLRDAGEDIEVFLLRRHGSSKVLGGAYVFPGGKTDAEDVDWVARLDRPAEHLHALLGEPALQRDQAAALFVTAIRELFEETGLLLAGVSAETARTHWAALRGGHRLEELLDTDVRLAAGALHPWSRWITPVLGAVGRKRFDTRFFLATLPTGHEATHDDHEATESTWLTPRAALRSYWDGAIELAPPQIMSLAHLARHRTVASVLAQAAMRKPPCILPEAHDDEGVRVLCYPGDARHPQGTQVLPGPTRLSWRNKRFEPDEGLAILLGD
jgi:8-oxo-dGTP pyrophosphatase MutT (NUDIX family)